MTVTLLIYIKVWYQGHFCHFLFIYLPSLGMAKTSSGPPVAWLQESDSLAVSFGGVAFVFPGSAQLMTSGDVTDGLGLKMFGKFSRVLG